MKPIICFFIFLSSFMHAENFYMSSYAGPNYLNHDGFEKNNFKVGYRVALSSGYILNPYWRIEAEGSYRRNRFTKLPCFQGKEWNPNLKAESYSLLANIYHDFFEYQSFISYIGLGLGWSRSCVKLSGEPNHFHTQEDRLAGQAIIGVKKVFFYWLTAGIEYRFFRYTDKIFEHSFGPSLTYLF